MSSNTYFKKCNILGVDIDVVTMKLLVDFISTNLNSAKGKYICVANVHTTVTANEDEYYNKIQNSSWITIPDGGPLSSYARKHSFPECERTTGPDLLEEILKISEENEFTHYFYGSTDETLEKLKSKISTQYPKVKIVGTYSPPFRKLTAVEEQKIVNIINSVNPDFIWIGLGAPKQEIFMFEHMNLFNGLMIGVGAAFDYKADNIKRAPVWMQKSNLEWVYRLLQSPKKLFKRYVMTNTKFILEIIKANILKRN